MWYHRKAANKQSATGNDTLAGTNGSSESDTILHNVTLWKDDDLLALKVSIGDIQDIKMLGSGAFADVWLVKFCGKALMASKRLRANDVTRKQIQDFIKDIKLVAQLKHLNIVALQHVAWVSESDLQALFEYMDGGDLRSYLTDPNVPVEWTTEKLQITIDIVDALVYVHSFLPPLVHRDLKSRNVLLRRCRADGISINDSSSNDTLCAKLTDFGVSRYQSVQNTMTAEIGTGRWLAPEVISGVEDYGPPADIWSFGVVLYELDSHAIPYANVCGANGKRLKDIAILARVATGELTPSMSATCPLRIQELARACFVLEPARRPTAPELAYALRTLQKSWKGGYDLV